MENGDRRAESIFASPNNSANVDASASADVDRGSRGAGSDDGDLAVASQHSSPLVRNFQTDPKNIKTRPNKDRGTGEAVDRRQKNRK